jgi:lipid II:glycine glycyltransferase (peptidoglycan interpeptide bridge formation enzyme)
VALLTITTDPLPATAPVPASGFCADVDQVSPAQWTDAIHRFDDATIYQTWAHDAVRWGEHRTSHFLLKRQQDVVAAAQVRILKAPVLKAGIAYLFKGPMWRLKGEDPNPDVFRHMISALRAEYVTRQGLLLRVIPNEIDREPDPFRAILESEGYRCRASAKAYRTFLLDLDPPLDVLRKNLRHTWRTNLNKAEARGFQIQEGTSDDLYAQFIGLYKEMHERKQFVQFVDVHQFRDIQRQLPDPEKMRIMLCSLDGEPVAAAVSSTLGQVALEVFLATNKKAMQTQAAFCLIWEQIGRFKQQNVRYFDIGGIDPEANPGGYRFKGGLGGQDISHVGEFEARDNLLSSTLVDIAQRARSVYRKFRIWRNNAARARGNANQQHQERKSHE